MRIAIWIAIWLSMIATVFVPCEWMGVALLPVAAWFGYSGAAFVERRF